MFKALALVGTFVMCSLVPLPAAFAQDLPKKQPVKIVVAADAGGLTDALARVTAEFLQRRLGRRLHRRQQRLRRFKRSLQISYGDPSIFLTRPISLALLIAGALMLALLVFPSIRRGREAAFHE